MGRLLLGLALWMAFVSLVEARPYVVILADARSTETTDLIAPYAILAESGAVDVAVVAADRRPIRLGPGKAWISPQVTLAELEQRRPDVVIVPAMAGAGDADKAALLRTQVRRGGRVMSICDGSKVLAAAGLLDGRDATTHWFSQEDLAKAHPTIRWRRDRRWVTDGPVTTTAGVSASAPASLQLLRELAGEAVMRRTAARMNLPPPDVRHAPEDYRLEAKGLAVVFGNPLIFWGQEDVALPVRPGFDELAFAVALDSWSRTYRSTAWAVAPPQGAVSRRGLTVYAAQALPEFERELDPTRWGAFEPTFQRIERAYGGWTARFVALQLEHPWGRLSAW